MATGSHAGRSRHGDRCRTPGMRGPASPAGPRSGWSVRRYRAGRPAVLEAVARVREPWQARTPSDAGYSAALSFACRQVRKRECASAPRKCLSDQGKNFPRKLFLQGERKVFSAAGRPWTMTRDRTGRTALDTSSACGRHRNRMIIWPRGRLAFRCRRRAGDGRQI